MLCPLPRPTRITKRAYPLEKFRSINIKVLNFHNNADSKVRFEKRIKLGLREVASSSCGAEQLATRCDDNIGPRHSFVTPPEAEFPCFDSPPRHKIKGNAFAYVLQREVPPCRASFLLGKVQV